MASRDNAYSRFIRLAKIVLPLAALGLLSTLFLLSTRPEGDGGLPYADIDLDEMAREGRISAPNYAGVTSDGTAIALKAETARLDPDSPDKGAAQAIVARLDLPDGSHTDIVAAEGAIDTGAERAVLGGGVTLTNSTGYRVTADRLTAALDHTNVVADTPVEATGPLGRLNAGAMELTESTDPPGRYVAVFKNGVKLVYDPQK
ncbi:lipopolysaccharide export system protein LptC [Rhodovulum iodosum]|uniref:Lipopolysaccharide export system protein LptC n=1 Tax=Rhodovulum iodosum TaxID=68291 RepID=A0ABV3XRT9_9RHOB|nr:LPS export ABC transporter periplasmic protein LptC [Rhodovulum robiginosum]RSK30383.1 hypothetical protein EJA01_16480 [Rhodovulum robiginosum]